MHNEAAPQVTELDAQSEDDQGIANAQASNSSLRWWPAALILVAMVLLRLLPLMAESPDIGLMMLAFIGPAALGVLLLVWWCFASRASIREKLVGTVALLVIAGIAISLLHFSMKGMFAVILVIPTGLAAFAIGLLVMSPSVRWRLPIALVTSLIGFGYWDLRQNEGTTGAFRTELLWRWEPTAEEQYLSELAKRSRPATSTRDSIPVTLESSPWPAFRGEDRNAVVHGVTLLSDWGSTKPTEVWKQKIGPGWSSLSVGGDRLYTQEQRGESEAVICLDAATGAMLWETTYPSRFWEAISGAGPRATPTIADEGIFALGADGILLRLDAIHGDEIWRRDLKKDAGRQPPMWGFSASPLVADSLVIVHAGGSDDRGLFAYATESGDVVWSVPSGNHSYSSAQLATFADQRGILMLTNDGLQFLNIADGATIWQHDWVMENYRVLQPCVVDQTVYFATSLQEGTRKLTVSRDEDGSWDLREAWTSRNMKTDYNDFVYHNGSLYGFDGGVFACIDADSGDRHWKRGRYGNGQVLLLAESGQLLVVSEKGEIVLIDATPEKLLETAKFQAIEGKTWNHPVLVGDRLYVRNAQETACYRMPVSVAGD